MGTTLSNTLSPTHSCLNTTIHTPPEMEPVNMTNQRDTAPSQDTMMFQETTPVPLDQLLLLDQSPLPLRPTRELSNSTNPVSSLSDMDQKVAKTTPSSRTHGVDHGVTKVTSRSPPTTTPAVSSRSHHTQSLEHCLFDQIKLEYFS